MMARIVFRCLLLLCVAAICSGSPKGPCHRALKKIKPGVIGAFVPRCMANGFYKGQQCHSSTGYCWCVTKLGKEIVNTRTRPGQKRVKCIDRFPRGPCHRVVMKVKLGVVGAYVPQCTTKGHYMRKQCHASTGYCWCVTKRGKEIRNTRKGPGQGKVKC